MAGKVVKTGTFIDSLEEAVDEVAEWAANYVEEVVDTLAPDGRAFGMKKLSKEEELKLYVQDLRGNEEAWAEWIRDRVEKVKEMLAKSGLDEDAILQAHPYDIVQRNAIAYSSRMEGEITKLLEQAEEDERREEAEYRTLPASEDLNGR